MKISSQSYVAHGAILRITLWRKLLMTGFYSRPEEFTVQRPLLKRRPVQLLFAKTHELRIRNTPQNLALPRITKQLGVNRLSCTVWRWGLASPCATDVRLSVGCEVWPGCPLPPAGPPWAHGVAHPSLSPAKILRGNPLPRWVSRAMALQDLSEVSLQPAAGPRSQYLCLTGCSDRKWKQRSGRMVVLWYLLFYIRYLKDPFHTSHMFCHRSLA